MTVKLSIIAPVFNENESLKELYTELKAVLSAMNETYEIIFIDDGSNDNSIDTLKGLRERDSHVTIIQLARNYGKSVGLPAGFKHASGDIVITLDGDLQDVPAEIPKLTNKLKEGYDLVCGWRLDRKDSLLKILMSKMFNFVTSLMTGVRLHDINCGFKCYRKEVVKNPEIYGELYRYIPVLASWKRYKISEIKVDHRPRKYGKSKYGLERVPGGFFDLFTVLLLIRNTKRSMYFFSGTGILFSLAGFLILLYLTTEWFLGHGIGRRPLLFLGILLIVSGIQLFSIGLSGTAISGEKIREEYEIKNIFDNRA